MKRLAIVGRGTAGCIAAAHFLRYTDWVVDFYYDSNIRPQAVGEATWPGFATDLYNTLNFNVFDLESVDGTFKTGVQKNNWNPDGTNFFHHLIPGSAAYHFNAVKLQNFIINKLENNTRVTFHNKNITDYDSVDADYIIVCTGKPTDFSTYSNLEYVSVNKAHVVMCYWDRPKFQYSLANATQYGWHFGIPLQNRCAIGYVYNDTFNTHEEVEKDIDNVIKDLNLTPSPHTNTIKFNSYKRDNNFTERVVYCGNASFFLEPLEATSFVIGDKIQRQAFDIWRGVTSPEEANSVYHQAIEEAEIMIMLHYAAGSKFNTPFWKYAKKRGVQGIQKAMLDKKFRDVILLSFQDSSYNMINDIAAIKYSGWGPVSYKQNIEGLGLSQMISQLL